MSWYCNTQTDVIGNRWMPHLHVKLTGNVGNSFHSFLWLPSTLIDTIFSLLPAVVPCALWRKGTYSWHSTLTARWGFQLFLTNSFKVGTERKKSWHSRSKFCPNSAVFAQTILFWHISPLLRVPKSMSRSTYHRRWLMLCLLCLNIECLLTQYEQMKNKGPHALNHQTYYQKSSIQKITMFGQGMGGKNKKQNQFS